MKTLKKSAALRVLSLLMAALVLLSCALLASCGKSGETLMKLCNSEINANTYELFLTRLKGSMANSLFYAYGDYNSSDYWDAVIDLDTGETNNDRYNALVLENMKSYLVALYLFDEVEKLKLSDADLAECRDLIDEIIATDGAGSKSKANSVLSNYGVNLDILEEIYKLELKYERLLAYYYDSSDGTAAGKIGDEAKNSYYMANYNRFKQIFVAKYFYVYETDENGDDIYYQKNEDGEPIYKDEMNKESALIAYDKENGTQKYNEDKVLIRDANGEYVYFGQDGRIAYDKENGIRINKFDSDGKYLVGGYDSEELAALSEAANAIKSDTDGKSDAYFELVAEENEDITDASTYAPDGYYLSKGTVYAYDYMNDINEALSGMAVGEVKVIESDYGYHVVRKYALEEGAYKKSENAEWFEGFASDLRAYLFSKKCEGYIDNIVVYPEAAKGIEIKYLAPNFNY